MIQAARLHRTLLAALFAFALGASQLASAQGGRGIVVFGTSLSDPGNAYAILGEAATPPDWSVDGFLVPDRPYARGGHHFSNGATWIEQLARPLGLAASVKPAFAGTGGTNFAFGGARARAGASASPDLSTQVGAFLQATGGVAPGAALYVIEMGGNDMRDALLAFATGGDGAPILNDALSAIALNVQTLYGAGARRFLIWNMPNIGVTPALNGNPTAVFLATLLAQQFNNGLAFFVLEPLRGAGADVAVVDAYGKLNAVVGSPATFGLENVTSACITIGAPFACAQPNDHLFWDGIHPTAAGHAIIAHEAAEALRR